MKLPRIGLAMACIYFLAWLSVAFAIAAYVAYSKAVLPGVRTVGVAASVCGCSAMAALLITGWTRYSSYAVGGILIACGLRFAVPLVAGIVLTRTSATLADAGLFGWIVVFYLWTLAGETVLSVLLDRDYDQGPAKASMTNG